MIESFKHKGLRQLFKDDNPRGVNPEHVRKIRQILAALYAAQMIEALNLPTFRLHPLTGNLKGFGQSQCAQIGGSFSVSITAKLSTLTSLTTIEGGKTWK